MRTAIYCSKKVGLRMRIRSGGHDFEGSSYVSNATFFVMDMFNYRYVKVNNKERTAWVGAGATIGETYYAINKTNSSLAFAAGYWPTIGVGGHVSGGGYGPLIRKHGLAADNVIDARIVDAKGRVLTRASMGEDVFWAIRGGTGASFCVILAYKVKLVAITPRVTAFRLYKTLETNATNLVHKWQFVAPKLPRDLLLSLQITSINSNQTGRKTIQASFVAVFQGGVPIPVEGLKKIWGQLFKIDNPPGRFEWTPFGGIMDEIPSTAIPFPYRAGNIFILFEAIEWNGSEPNLQRQRIAWIRQMQTIIGQYVAKNPRRAYADYRDLDLGINNPNFTSVEVSRNWAVPYFNQNYERLVRAKTHIDPFNYFNTEQSIPPYSPRK
ncbi:tetrahydrocannabinolic acid synthase-like [Coffea eugenioides]|uniref:tetrahydrocannabinolic acid synthase-like n=1 Tax=Coffea eugenioides TaxID=49369 RepID=UPI000F60DDDD|nr:tetrahydrocannabinolic acid synthase-like [Coffea eugenioides]XP_027185068.1 tetrahydrocannabinolic acid synthase-like [Coffea eugenioides]